MNERATITISKRAPELAEKRAAEEGVSPGEYVDELISGDSLDEALDQARLREMIEEGLKSGNAESLREIGSGNWSMKVSLWPARTRNEDLRR